MNMDLPSKALAVIADISGKSAADLRPEQDLVADLGIDSPKALQMLVRLEDDLGVEIEDEDAARMNTVGDILSFLEGVPGASA